MRCGQETRQATMLYLTMDLTKSSYISIPTSSFYTSFHQKSKNLHDARPTHFKIHNPFTNEKISQICYQVLGHCHMVQDTKDYIVKQESCGVDIGDCTHHVSQKSCSFNTLICPWTDPQLSIMIIYNSSWSLLIQWIRNLLSGDNLT